MKTSSYMVDLACLAFAAWTMLCQVVVNLGGTALELRASVLVAALVCVAVCGWYGRRVAALLTLLPDTGGPAVPSAVSSPAARPWVVRLSWLLVAAAGVVLAAYGRAGDEERLALFAIPIFGLALAGSFLWRSPESSQEPSHAPQPSTAPGSVAGVWSLWPLALLTLVFTLCANRPDTDEAFYLSVASAMLREPGAAIMGADPVHGMSDWPLQLPVYRAHTAEVLAGLLAGLSGVAPIYFTHVALAGLAAVLTPLAWMRFFREILPQRAVLCVWLTVVLLVADGGADQSYANFAMVRLYQGKAILLTGVVPVVFAYGIRFARAPSALRFVLLVAAQVAATGLSSIAIPLIPLVAGCALIAGLPRPAAYRRLVVGMCASLYPILLGALFYLQMRGADGVERLLQSAIGHADEATRAGWNPDLLAETYTRVLSAAGSRWLYLIALFAVPLLGHTATARRLAATCGFVFFSFLVNPIWVSTVSEHLFGASTYWRVFWLLPLPALVVALVVSLSLRLPGPPSPRTRSVLATVVVLALAFALPARPVFAQANRITFGPPGLKVDRYYAVARRASELATRRATVAAHPRVSVWLGAFEKPVYPVYVKASYLKRRHRRRREQLIRCIVYPQLRCSARALGAHLSALRVGVVVLPPQAKAARRKRAGAQSLGAALRLSSFKLAERLDGAELWVRRGYAIRPGDPGQGR